MTCFWMNQDGRYEGALEGNLEDGSGRKGSSEDSSKRTGY